MNNPKKRTRGDGLKEKKRAEAKEKINPKPRMIVDDTRSRGKLQETEGGKPKNKTNEEYS